MRRNDSSSNGGAARRQSAMSPAPAPALTDDHLRLNLPVRLGPLGRPVPRDLRWRKCRVCKVERPTGIYDDADGATARVMLPHGACPGSLRAVR